MELKDQVCSLEQAKRLKELGVKLNDSLFRYAKMVMGKSMNENLDPLKQDGHYESWTLIDKSLYPIWVEKDWFLEHIHEGKSEWDEGQWSHEYLDYEEGEIGAFTVAELGEMLPDEIGLITWEVHPNNHSGLWECTLYDLVKWNGNEIPPTAYEGEGDTMAEAMADVLIYCIENKLVNL